MLKESKHYQKIQRAIDYIEANLDASISLRDVSNVAFSSLSYFHRVFFYLTGYTLKEYIRRRRLAKAAFELVNSNKKVIDIALDSFYESPESFARAFKKQYKLSPRQFRNENQEHPVFKSLNIFDPNKNYERPEMLIEQSYVVFKETKITGFKTRTSIENSVDICDFSDEILLSGKLSNYFSPESPIYGIYTDMSDSSNFDYTIAGAANLQTKENTEFVSHIIPTSQYAKFINTDLSKIKEAWRYIYGFWIPENDQLRTKGFDFEIYKEDSVEIYIPMQANN